MSRQNNKVPGISNTPKDEGVIGEVVSNLKNGGDESDTLIIDVEELEEGAEEVRGKVDKATQENSPRRGISDEVKKIIDFAGRQANSTDGEEISEKEQSDIKDAIKKITGKHPAITDEDIRRKGRRSGEFPITAEKPDTNTINRTDTKEGYTVITDRKTGENKVVGSIPQEAKPEDSGSYAIHKPKTNDRDTVARVKLTKRPSGKQKVINKVEENEGILEERKKRFLKILELKGLLEEIKDKIKVDGKWKNKERYPHLDEVEFNITYNQEGYIDRMDLRCLESGTWYIYTNGGTGAIIAKIKDGKLVKEVKIGQ